MSRGRSQRPRGWLAESLFVFLPLRLYAIQALRHCAGGMSQQAMYTTYVDVPRQPTKEGRLLVKRKGEQWKPR